MHEMGIALQVIDIAAAAIPPEHDGCKVERINLKIGKLTAVVPQSLEFCLGIAAKETPLEHAEVTIEEVPVMAQCRSCLQKWQVDEPAFKCPHCRSGDLEIISGRELDVVSIDIADLKDPLWEKENQQENI